MVGLYADQTFQLLINCTAFTPEWLRRANLAAQTSLNFSEATQLTSKGPRKKCLVKFLHDLDLKVNAPCAFEHDQLSLKFSLHPPRRH